MSHFEIETETLISASKRIGINHHTVRKKASLMGLKTYKLNGLMAIEKYTIDRFFYNLKTGKRLNQTESAKESREYLANPTVKLPVEGVIYDPLKTRSYTPQNGRLRIGQIVSYGGSPYKIVDKFVDRFVLKLVRHGKTLYRTKSILATEQEIKCGDK